MTHLTTLQVAKIRHLLDKKGYSLPEAANAVGLPYRSVLYAFHSMGIKPPYRRSHGKLAQYGAYDRKTDELVALGTGPEVAALLGISLGTLQTYVSKGNGKYQIVRLEGEGGHKHD